MRWESGQGQGRRRGLGVSPWRQRVTGEMDVRRSVGSGRRAGRRQSQKPGLGKRMGVRKSTGGDRGDSKSPCGQESSRLRRSRSRREEERSGGGCAQIRMKVRGRWQVKGGRRQVRSRRRKAVRGRMGVRRSTGGSKSFRSRSGDGQSQSRSGVSRSSESS